MAAKIHLLFQETNTIAKRSKSRTGIFRKIGAKYGNYYYLGNSNINRLNNKT